MVAVEKAFGAGSVIVYPSPFGLIRDLNITPRPEYDQPLACPYRLHPDLEKLVARELTSQLLFRVGDGLGYVTCRESGGRYVIGVYNNDPVERPFHIESLCGTIADVAELEVGCTERDHVGYWPECVTADKAGANTAATIAGGDIRLFRVTLAQESIALREPSKPPARPMGRSLTIRGNSSIQEAVLSRPTFFDHFDGVAIDWRALNTRDMAAVAKERAWIDRQKLSVTLDLSEGLNFYPDLVLLNTFAPRYDESLETIRQLFAKAACLGVRDVVLSLHRQPEGHCDAQRTQELFEAGLRTLSDLAAGSHLDLHLTHHKEKWLGTYSEIAQMVQRLALPNLRPAFHVGHAFMTGEAGQVPDDAQIVLLSAPRRDAYGQLYDFHDPLYRSEWTEAAGVRIPAGKTVIFDAVFANQDDEYLEARFIERS
jgi:sugar phosphate isomerase/epimerase